MDRTLGGGKRGGVVGGGTGPETGERVDLVSVEEGDSSETKTTRS